MISQEVRQSPETEPRFFYGYVIVVVAFLMMLLMHGTLNTFGIFFKPLSTYFDWNSALTSGAFSLSISLLGLLAVATGRLTDRFGPRVVLSGCGFFLGLGYLLMSQTSATWQLYLFYGVVIAIGMSGCFVPFISTVARWFVKRRGLMTGVTVAGVGAGTMIIPPLANWLISNHGWRTSYAIMGFVVLAVIILAAQFLRRNPAQMRQLPYGHNEIPADSSNLRVRGFSLKEAMRTRQFRLLCVALLSFSFQLQTIMVHIVPLATEVGISTTAAANIFIALGALSIVGRIAIGSASDRIGIRSALIICFILVTAALVWLLVAEEMWMFYLFAIVFGLAAGGIAALISPSVAELFGLSSHGVIVGVVVLIMSVGAALGPVLAGGIFDTTGSYDWAFVVCTVVAVIGLVSAVLLRVAKKT
jgi:MFS family permease